MKLTTIETKVSGMDKEDVARVAMFSKLIEKKLLHKFSNNSFEILVNLYLHGGTTSKESLNIFVKSCYNKKLAKPGAENSIRNTLTLARANGIIKRKSVNNWKIAESFMKQCSGEYLVHRNLMTNFDINAGNK